MTNLTTPNGKNARYLALEASAGSGKTFSLAVRFVGLVLLGENINEILALTFTKKAAAEMKVRVINTFLELGTQARKGELGALCGLLGKDESEILSLRDKYSKAFMDANLNISTFDSFFGKILRAFSLNAGINPNFKNDDNVKQAQQTAFLARIFKDDLIEQTDRYLSDGMLSKSGFLQSIHSFWENGILPEVAETDAPNLDEINKILANMRAILARNGASATAINQTRSARDISKLCETRAWLDRESLKEHRTFKKAFEPSLDAEFANLKSAVLDYILKFEKFQISTLSLFLKFYSATKKDISKKLGKMSFADVSVGVHELLGDKEKAEFNRELIYFRLDSRIKHLLIDEFQDTNVLQYEIILPLIAEIVAGSGQKGVGSFFYVGDKKQSIYKFRGAKKELFDDLQTKFSQIECENMPKNYRSLKLLVKFVNKIFEGKISNFTPQIAHNSLSQNLPSDIKDKILKYPRENKNFEFFEVEDDDYGYLRACSYDDILEGAVSEVENLRQNGVAPSDIAVLCWTNKDAAQIQEMLLNLKIDSSTGATKKLIQMPQIGAINEYAKFLISGDKIHKENIKALLNLNDEPQIKPLNLSENATLVGKRIAENLWLNFSDENLLMFFENLGKYDSFTQYIFADESADAYACELGGVKIMTVHKSKGLEFKHVILCDTTGKGANDTDKFLLSYDEQWRIKCKISNRELVDDEYKKFKDDLAKLEEAETINKLYVGFTRAECSLIIVKKAPPLNGNIPSYFSPYDKKESERVEILDIPDFEFGYVIPSEISHCAPPKVRKIELAHVAAQEILDEQTSENDGTYEDLGKIYFGNALHYALEMMSDFKPANVAHAVNLCKNQYAKFLRAESFAEIEKRIRALCENVEFHLLINGGEIYHEMPIKSPSNEIFRIDLVCEKADEILLFDYKSSDKYIEKNSAQVRNYKDLVGAMSQKSVCAYVLVVGKNGVKLVLV